VSYPKQGKSWLRRIAGARMFHFPLLRFAEHYGFTPLEAPPRVPWAVGRLKRPVCLVRSLFLNHLASQKLEEQNLALLGWLERREENENAEPGITVRQKFEVEKPFLGGLPTKPYVRLEVKLRQFPKSILLPILIAFGAQIFFVQENSWIHIFPDSRIHFFENP
jgi:hypothetical protein